MPELPEVEVITRGLRPHLKGKTIISIWHSGKHLRTPVPYEILRKKLRGEKIADVTRRAKYIQIALNSGSLFIVHLGMTGNMGIFPGSSRKTKHDHIELGLDDGKALRLNDVRRFGSVHFLSASDAQQKESTIFKTAGPEPFDDSFSADYLYKTASNRNITVKQFIMTSQVVVGIGNIYANESLFRARIRPTRKINSLTKKNWSDLIDNIRKVLKHAIECGGSTISDFLNANQESGYFQMNFKVYGKNGEKCSCCSSIIKKEVIGGRASFFCSNCQK